MPYEQPINTRNPTLMIFLLDQSGSMAEPWGIDATRTKAQGVAEAVNGLINVLVSECCRGTVVRDRYFLGVVGYGRELNLGFPGSLAGRISRPVSQIASCPLRMEQRRRLVADGTGGRSSRCPSSPCGSTLWQTVRLRCVRYFAWRIR